MKSWKTTLAGAIAALASFLAKSPDVAPVVQQVADLISMVAIGAMGAFARDNNVSSEKAGAK